MLLSPTFSRPYLGSGRTTPPVQSEPASPPKENTVMQSVLRAAAASVAAVAAASVLVMVPATAEAYSTSRTCSVSSSRGTLQEYVSTYKDVSTSGYYAHVGASPSASIDYVPAITFEWKHSTGTLWATDTSHYSLSVNRYVAVGDYVHVYTKWAVNGGFDKACSLDIPLRPTITS